jgi:hypothetical protein
MAIGAARSALTWRKDLRGIEWQQSTAATTAKPNQIIIVVIE